MQRATPVLSFLALAGLAACSAPDLDPARADRGRWLSDRIADDELNIAPVGSASLSGIISIDELLDAARVNNASLMRAGYSALIVRAQRDEAFANVVLPKLNGQLSYFRRNNQPATRSNFGGQSFKIPIGQRDMTMAGATFDQPIFSLADHIYRFNSFKLETRAAKLSYRRAWQEVRLVVLQTAFDLMELEDTLRGVDALIDSLKKRLGQVEDNLRFGTSIRRDVLRVKGEIANQGQNQIELQNSIATTRVALNTLVGVDPDAFYAIAWPRAMPTGQQPPSIGDAFAKALLNRPDLLGIELRKKAADERRKTEWASYLPRLDARLEYQYSDADQLVEDDYFAYSLLGSIELLDFGRHARIDKAKAEIGELSARGLELERQLRVDVELACRSVANELSRYKNAQILVESSEENAKVERERLEAGNTTIVDLIDAEVELVRDQVNLNIARLRYFKRLAELDAVTGVDGYAFGGGSVPLK